MNWISYLIQANLFLALFYGLYWSFLRKETFNTNNRVYLVGSAFISFAIPFWNSEMIQSWIITRETSTILYGYELSGIIIRNHPPQPEHFDVLQLLSLIYGIGVVFFLIRFLVSVIRLRHLLTAENPAVKAFSFFNTIFVDSSLISNDTIHAHERVHARQAHSFDVILFEILGIICWFNPAIWFYKISIRNLHEFIADEVACRHLPSKADYAVLLFSQQFLTQPNYMVNNFFDRPTLKLRIQMLRKERSQKMALLKYGLIVPLFIGMLIFTSATIADRSTEKLAEIKLNLSDTPTEPKKVIVESMTPPAELPAASLKLSAPSEETAAAELTKEPVFTAVEQNPEFPGGQSAMYRFINQNIDYPTMAQRANVSGRVFLKFVVEKDGSISNVEVLKGLGFGCDEESIRVIKSMPKWKSGRQDGSPVRVYYNMPIFFQLE